MTTQTRPLIEGGGTHRPLRYVPNVRTPTDSQGGTRAPIVPAPKTRQGTTTPGGGTSGGGTSGGTAPGNPPVAAPFVAAVIPPTGKLLRVTDPMGSDAAALYFVEYLWEGVPVRFEVGDDARLAELFGTDLLATFTSMETQTQAQFDNAPALTWGTIDEQLGETESIQSQVERGVREVGAGDIAPWQRQSPQVMLAIATGAREGWSADRTLMEVSKTQAFADRYAGFSDWRRLTGSSGNLTTDLNAYVTEERNVKQALRAFRGPQTDLSDGYVGSLLASGWTSEEMGEVLDFEHRLTGQPEALDNLNELLQFNNLGPVTAAGMLDIIRGKAAPEVFEVLNDALRQTELEGQRLNISTSTAAALGMGSLGLQDPAAIRSQAQEVAMDIFANKRELDLGKYGLTEDILLKAAFNGEASAEVATRLGQLARERSAAAQGFTDMNAYQGQRGELKVVGLGNL